MFSVAFRFAFVLVASVPAVIVCVVASAGAAEPAFSTVTRSQSFDVDPGWEAQNNRVVPKEYPTIEQAFGYSATSHAGKSPGEMGGLVTRASEPAFYAAKIEPKTLDDKLSASGTFALTKTTPGGGVFFGFFRAEQPGGGGRPIGSLGLNLDCEHSGGRLAVRLITDDNQSCGTFATSYLPGKYRPTPLKNDGTRYAFTLDYDPQAAAGRGRFTFTLTCDNHPPGEVDPALPPASQAEARARFPHTTTFAVDLPEGYRKQVTTFDHFGMMNMMKAGGNMSIYFDDLAFSGKSQDFSQDPSWDAQGNRRTYQAVDVGGAHNFGFSDTNHAGGKAKGEVGGTFWRSGDYAYYADRVGPLTMDDRLGASGKVVLKVGAPDADMFLGWFNGTDKKTPPMESANFLGVHVGGPTRVGHYFHPAFNTAKGTHGLAQSGPVLGPGKTYDWSLVYDPTAEGGRGSISVTLGDKTETMVLKQGIKAQGGNFDRFGLVTSTIGGQIVKIYLDDLTYTVGNK